jgi:thiamine biosynthesis lipoprotein
MHMYRKFIAPTVVIVLVIAFSLFYKGPKMTYKRITGETQGTTYNITYEYKKNRDLQPAIEKKMREYEMSLSIYEPQSIISRINSNDPDVEVDELFVKVFEKAKEVYDASDGAFDMTVGPLVNAWGFGPVPASDIDSSIIDSLLQFVGMNKVKLEGKKIIKENPAIKLDDNAIAQGFSVDVICAFLDSKKIENYLVEIGGELKCKGINSKGKDWVIGIDRPEYGNIQPGSNIQAIIALRSRALATSGNYRKFYEKDGVKYAHHINPKTGYPEMSRLLSATVLADNCITADAFGTVFMVMGLDKSIEFLEKHKELDAYLIYSDIQGTYQVYATEGMQEHILEER